MQAFCAVVEQGSFVAAARALDLSPALVSKYVSQLEAHLGARLLQRSTRSLSLTEAGETCFARASAILAEVEALEDALHQAQSLPCGRLRLTAPRVLGEDMLAPILAGFLRAYPDITLELHLSDRFEDIVAEGFDLAIRIGALRASSLIARRLAGWKVVVAGAPGYLARHGRPEHPEDLTEHACIIDRNFSGGAVWPFRVAGERLSVAVSGQVSANSAMACRDLALAGLGLVLSPEHVLRPALDSGALVPLLEQYCGFESAVYAVYPDRGHLPAKTRALLDFLVRAFAADPPGRRAKAMDTQEGSS